MIGPKLPAAYGWLPRTVELPRMLQEALPLYGTLEAPGAADNPVIVAWGREVGLASVYKHDATAWCGLFMALVARRADKPVVEGPLWALNWRRFGVESPRPSLGDVLVFTRPGGGHVGLYAGEDAQCWHVLGGNTADSVSIARLLRSRLVAARRPAYRVVPRGARPVVVSATGAPLSGNEA